MALLREFGVSRVVAIRAGVISLPAGFGTGRLFRIVMDQGVRKDRQFVGLGLDMERFVRERCACIVSDTRGRAGRLDDHVIGCRDFFRFHMGSVVPADPDGSHGTVIGSPDIDRLTPIMSQSGHIFYGLCLRPERVVFEDRREGRLSHGRTGRRGRQLARRSSRFGLCMSPFAFAGTGSGHTAVILSPVKDRFAPVMAQCGYVLHGLCLCFESIVFEDRRVSGLSHGGTGRRGRHVAHSICCFRIHVSDVAFAGAGGGHAAVILRPGIDRFIPVMTQRRIGRQRFSADLFMARRAVDHFILVACFCTGRSSIVLKDGGCRRMVRFRQRYRLSRSADRTGIRDVSVLRTGRSSVTACDCTETVSVFVHYTLGHRSVGRHHPGLGKVEIGIGAFQAAELFRDIGQDITAISR